MFTHASVCVGSGILGLVMLNKIIAYLNFKMIDFEIAILYNNTPVPAFLPLLECGLGLIFRLRVEELFLLILNLDNVVRKMIFVLNFYFG